MKLNINKSGDRGYFDHDWLKTYHTYSFAEYYNPERMGFGKLRVFNDDFVGPGSGFGTHPHKNMEIISIPLVGSIYHKDNFGNGSIIAPGDVQIMSAGTGIYHSEFNASETEPVNFLQIWIIPDKMEIRPAYEQKTFGKESLKNNFRLIASPYKKDDSLFINQDAYIYLTDVEKDYKVEFTLNNPKNGVFLFVIDGAVKIDKMVLNKRDSAEISGSVLIKLYADTDSSLLFIEVPI